MNTAELAVIAQAVRIMAQHIFDAPGNHYEGTFTFEGKKYQLIFKEL